MPFSDARVATHITEHNHTVLSRTIASQHHPHTAHAAQNTHSSITTTLTADIQTLQRAVPLQRRCKRRRAVGTNVVL
jgi:hypothetical protein